MSVDCVVQGGAHRNPKSWCGLGRGYVSRIASLFNESLVLSLDSRLCVLVAAHKVDVFGHPKEVFRRLECLFEGCPFRMWSLFRWAPAKPLIYVVGYAKDVL
jgi:hypothetical protein